MDCYVEIPYIENNIKKLNIKTDMHSGYKHNLYHYKQEIIDEMFCQYIKPLFKNIDHPELIQERKQNIDADA